MQKQRIMSDNPLAPPSPATRNSTQESNGPRDNAVARATENMNNYPAEELARYEDKWVAWTMDGTRIIAGADDINALEPAIIAAGMKMSDVVFEYIPPLDQAFLGAGG